MISDHSLSIPPARHVRLRVQLAVFSTARLALNTGNRMVYPFLPTMARGLGVDLDALALAVTARSSLGLFSPTFGSLADRYGRKSIMLAGILCFAVAMSAVTLWPTYPVLFGALLLANLSKLLYDPSMQAYIGDRVQYSQRGLAIAITELSWSGAFLLMMPVLGWLIARTDRWYSPFPLLAVTSFLAVGLLWRTMPSDAVQVQKRPSLVEGLRIVLAYSPALAALAMGFMLTLGNETIGIVYGAWLEDAFKLKVTALGASAIVIGIAELAGEGTVAGFVDRIGKRRAVAAGLALNSAACILLPAFGFDVEGAMVGLFLFYLTFEFTLVSSIPLMTELIPSARATLLAANVTAYAGGRMLGSFIGPHLYDLGLLANGIAAAIFELIALAVLILFIRQE